MKKLFFITLAFFALLSPSTAQQPSIRVSPNGVNVNANGASVVLLTFGPLRNQRPAEGSWCGELIPATPDIGFKCNPTTIWGSVPARFDFSTRSANNGFTDVMTIPNSVARRAYQAAQEGANSSYFYVRRFVSTNSGRDEYVAVTCRMGSGGARTPLALTDVKLSFADNQAVLMVNPGASLPAIKAEISYNGTGRLKGRWEVVKPGDELPTERDLLTEATLPLEERGTQQRYAQIGTFNYHLPPTGKFTLPGPEVARLPNVATGAYQILLRIEATDDKDGDANLLNVGGPGVLHNGAVAGFPLPTLRYFVSSGGNAAATAGTLTLLLPTDNAVIAPEELLRFHWAEMERAAFYRLEVEDLLGRPLLMALLPAGVGTYRAPAWLKDKAASKPLRWRVRALDPSGKPLTETPWHSLRLNS